MNEEEQRISIAEACGWDGAASMVVGPTVNFPVDDDSKPEWSFIEQLPDYLNDLNDCHEMEKTLINRGACSFWHGWMESACKTPEAAFHATARQRCEAFLKTIGKWKEDQE